MRAVSRQLIIKLGRFRAWLRERVRLFLAGRIVWGLHLLHGWYDHLLAGAPRPPRAQRWLADRYGRSVRR